MGYYRGGDYYRGDYYRGDIFSSILKGVTKVGSFIPGPVGTLAKIANTALTLAPPKAKPTMVPIGAAGGQVIMDAGNFPISISQPRGINTVETSNYDQSIPAFRNERRPGDTGRVGHFKKDGTWTNRARPRMQVTNTRALKRAGRRVRGFLRIARQLGALPIARGKGKRLFRSKRK